MRTLAIFISVLTLAPGFARADANSDFRAVLDADWQWSLRDQPTFASAIGDHRYDDRWSDESPAAYAARRAHHKEVAEQLKKIDRAQLSAAAQLDYDLYSYKLARAIEGDRFPDEYLAIDQMGGVYSDLPQLVQRLSLLTAKDYRALLERMHRYPLLVDQTIALLKKGIETGVMPPSVLMIELPRLIDAHIAAPEKTPLWQLAFADMPAAIDKKTQDELRARAKKLLADEVVPAISRLRSFVVDSYIPKARADIGFSKMPDGIAWYNHRIKVFTTTDLTADRIHQIGLAEVARIRGEMQAVMKASGWKGDLPGFFTFLKTDKRFFFDDRQQLVSAYRELAKRIDPELPRLFRTLPRLPYGIMPTPAYAEKTAPAAYYTGGAQDLGKAGRFWANTYDLGGRPKWEMEALTLHEAVPGHHLQIAIAQELPEVPEFRRWGGFTGFIEGWGLYAESLGSELGLYKDPYAKFGQLTFEMWRAVRLVVDTGMHSKGWTRAQAIQFFVDNTSKPLHDIEVEVDRYIAWPGQALAYKLGQLKIKELRAHATKELGERMSIRDFHDAVLGAGALPLDVLDARIRRWVATQKAAKTK
jgi:uncharacterized protein (DUF885 family)